MVVMKKVRTSVAAGCKALVACLVEVLTVLQGAEMVLSLVSLSCVVGLLQVHQTLGTRDVASETVLDSFPQATLGAMRETLATVQKTQIVETLGGCGGIVVHPSSGRSGGEASS